MLKNNFVLSLCLIAMFFSCSSDDHENNQSLNDTPFFEASYSTSLNNLSVDHSLFEDEEVVGELDFSQIDEASGIAVSRQNPNFLWTHNDSGDLNRIFLIHRDGSHLGTFRLTGTGNRDWEDMAIGGGPNPDLDYLYVGDIGDNNAVYPVKQIYRIPEPDVNLADNSIQWKEIDGAEKISFTYPEGKMIDAESLMIDPLSLDLFIVTKREFPVTVYRLPYPQSTTETMVAEEYGTLPFTLATAGDISPTGEEIVLKTKERIFMWTRTLDESIAEAFQREPIRLPYLPEPQGEAIGFSPDNQFYYTLSEQKGGEIPRVYAYRRK